MGLSMGAFAAPNRAGVMNSLPAAAPRRRRRHEPDLPELGAGALDRHLLHADDHRALGDAARTRSPPGSRRTACPPPRRRTSATCRRSRCSSPRSSATTRRSTLIGPHVLAHLSAANAAAIERPQLLPQPDRRPVPRRAPRGVHVRDRRLSRRRGRVLVARESRRRTAFGTRAGRGARSRRRLGRPHLVVARLAEIGADL